MNIEGSRTYLVIGHVTKDRRADGSLARGGTVFYAAATAQRFGWRPAVITACDPSFEPPEVVARDCWHVVESTVTTTFYNEPSQHGRKQVIEALASQIGPESIPGQCRDAPLVHLAPVAGEVDAAIVTQFPKAFKVATLQGWLRKWDSAGAVTARRWPDAENVLSKLRAAVCSIDDIGGDWEIAKSWASHVPVLVVTQEDQGCMVFHDARREHVPARPAEVADPTGAGDVFAAVFFILLSETGDVVRSAAFANIAASMSVEHPGIEGIPLRSDAEDCMRRSSLFGHAI